MHDGAGGSSAGEGRIKKETEAMAIVVDVLGSTTQAVAGFGGGKESVVLLHLLRRGLGIKPLIPILCSYTPDGHTRLFYFADKVARLWGFEPLRARCSVHPADLGMGLAEKEPYPGVYGLVHSARRQCGATAMFLGLRRDEEGIAGEITPVMNCGGLTLVNPLAGFTQEDVWGYIKAHGLPSCSLYRPGLAKLWCLKAQDGHKHFETVGLLPDEGDADIRERLKSLGYL